MFNKCHKHKILHQSGLNNDSAAIIEQKKGDQKYWQLVSSSPGCWNLALKRPFSSVWLIPPTTFEHITPHQHTITTGFCGQTQNMSLISREMNSSLQDTHRSLLQPVPNYSSLDDATHHLLCPRTDLSNPVLKTPKPIFKQLFASQKKKNP